MGEAAPTDRLPAGESLIGDAWVGTATAGWYEHVNPATGKVQRVVPLSGGVEVDRAVEAARKAAPAWRRTTAELRREVLTEIARRMEAASTDLAETATLENGVPITFAGFVAGTEPVEWFRYYAGWADKLHGDAIAAYPREGLHYSVPEPYGVVGVIIPWNGPVTSIGMKVAPALAAGNCVVLKPPELAPFTAVKFAEICLEAGLPPGVLNVVVGGAEAGDALVRHPGVGKISFTGGRETARRVQVAAAEALTPLVLELGGKSANVVFADADLDAAVAFAVSMGVAALSGQGCVLPTRLLVEDSVYEQVLDDVVAVAEAIPVGDPFDDATMMGPVVSERQCARIEGFIREALDQKSGRLVTGGERLGGSLTDGYFLPPTVLAEVDNGSRLAQEEIFGPVLSVMPFRKEAEAVALANDTRYGLGGYVWTQDVKRAHRVASGLEAGSISINGALSLAPNVPFGGFKESGYGREGGYEGLLEFVRMKNVCLDLG